MRVFTSGVPDPEGPVCLPDGSWIITEMESGCINHISADGLVQKTIAFTGRPNGLTLDSLNRLWVAESRDPSLLCVSLSGDVTKLTTGPSDLPFLWPNDLCFGPDGALYMTDSGIRVDDLEGIGSSGLVYQKPIDGRVYRIDPATGACRVLDRGLRFANGVAFGPGGTYLYVAETLTGHIYRYHIVGGRVAGKRELFSNVMTRPPSEFGQIAGPDGMAFDEKFNLYVAVLIQGDITVLNSAGDVTQRIKLPGNFPTNVAFGPPGEKNLLITEGMLGQLLLLDTSAAGLPLFSG